MAVEAAFRTFVLSDSAVATLVDNRMFPVPMPEQVALPAISFFLVSGQRPKVLSGSSGKAISRVQVDCWAETYAGAKDLAAAVESKIDGAQGAWSGVNVGECEVVNVQDIYEDESNLHRVTLDVMIIHSLR